MIFGFEFDILILDSIIKSFSLAFSDFEMLQCCCLDCCDDRNSYGGFCTVHIRVMKYEAKKLDSHFYIRMKLWD